MISPLGFFENGGKPSLIIATFGSSRCAGGAEGLLQGRIQPELSNSFSKSSVVFRLNTRVFLLSLVMQVCVKVSPLLTRAVWKCSIPPDDRE